MTRSLMGLRVEKLKECLTPELWKSPTEKFELGNEKQEKIDGKKEIQAVTSTAWTGSC